MASLLAALRVRNDNRPRVAPSFRPQLEALESQETPSVSPIAPPALGPALFGHPSTSASLVGIMNSIKHDVSSLPPITIGSVAVSPTGQLSAYGVIGNQLFSIAVTFTTSSGSSAASAASTSTPIVTLHLAPIDLNVLGLEVKTSEICLNVTAQSGTPLGNLLGNIANSLNGSGPSLGSILSSLTSDQLGSLTSLLNGAMGAVYAAATTSPSTTDILHLSLGPVNLNLLGLNVTLDNCAGGPVTVDVLANAGPGNLLGNLLTDVENLGRRAKGAVRRRGRERKTADPVVRRRARALGDGWFAIRHLDVAGTRGTPSVPSGGGVWAGESVYDISSSSSTSSMMRYCSGSRPSERSRCSARSLVATCGWARIRSNIATRAVQPSAVSRSRASAAWSSRSRRASARVRSSRLAAFAPSSSS